jgi:DNA polymerase-4
MKYSEKTSSFAFNPKPSTIMHVDLNSCFATVEQQANPHLRGKPVAVAAYTTPSGCIIAPSVEAKKLGIKVGMRVKDGKAFCRDLIVLPPDPRKYRNVHIKLRKLLSSYTNKITPKSIDEFVLDLEDFLSLPHRGYPLKVVVQSSIYKAATEIKRRIKEEVGDWITVSIGVAPNRFLAKLAAGLNKPDGLDEINKDNYLDIYSTLKLTNLCGIKIRNAIRLNRFLQCTDLEVKNCFSVCSWLLLVCSPSWLGD